VVLLQILWHLVKQLWVVVLVQLVHLMDHLMVVRVGQVVARYQLPVVVEMVAQDFNPVPPRVVSVMMVPLVPLQIRPAAVVVQTLHLLDLEALVVLVSSG
jgi:hypothetical protein